MDHFTTFFIYEMTQLFVVPVVPCKTSLFWCPCFYILILLHSILPNYILPHSKLPHFMLSSFPTSLRVRLMVLGHSENFYTKKHTTFKKKLDYSRDESNTTFFRYVTTKSNTECITDLDMLNLARKIGLF